MIDYAGNTSDDSRARARYLMLRRLFILGYAMNIALWFIPSVVIRGNAAGFFAPAQPDRTLSMFSLVRLTSQENPFLTLFFVLVFASNIAFIVLAIKMQKRWVFLTGAILSAIFLLWGLFSSAAAPENVYYIPLIRYLGYIASALILVGFVIGPVAETTEEEEL